MCHEGNYSLTNMLKGYRAAEQKPAGDARRCRVPRAEVQRPVRSGHQRHPREDLWREEGQFVANIERDQSHQPARSAANQAA